MRLYLNSNRLKRDTFSSGSSILFSLLLMNFIFFYCILWTDMIYSRINPTMRTKEQLLIKISPTTTIVLFLSIIVITKLPETIMDVLFFVCVTFHRLYPTTIASEMMRRSRDDEIWEGKWMKLILINCLITLMSTFCCPRQKLQCFRLLFICFDEFWPQIWE